MSTLSNAGDTVDTMIPPSPSAAYVQRPAQNKSASAGA